VDSGNSPKANSETITQRAADFIASPKNVLFKTHRRQISSLLECFGDFVTMKVAKKA
jgi:hypothetical protein